MIGTWARPSKQSKSISLSRKLVFFLSHIDLIARLLDATTSPTQKAMIESVRDSSPVMATDAELLDCETHLPLF